jgi:hypothetical protein
MRPMWRAKKIRRLRQYRLDGITTRFFDSRILKNVKDAAARVADLLEK